MVKKFTLTILLLCAFCATFAANYLTFTAETDSSSFGILDEGGNDPIIQFSMDNGETWVTMPYYKLILLEHKGDKALLRGYNPNGFSENSQRHTSFIMQRGAIAASGSVMSLVDEEGESTVIPAPYCFYRLFYACESLTQAPELPAIRLRKSCYEEMFSKCTSLKEAPALLATSLDENCYNKMFKDCSSLVRILHLSQAILEEGCYEGMFWNCTSLEKAPELSSLHLRERCYTRMFRGCANLTEAPELPAPYVSEYCYEGMFMDCPKISKITVNFTEWGIRIPIRVTYEDGEEDDEILSRSTQGWLNGVAPQGTFICPKELPEEFGGDAIPKGWKVVRKKHRTLEDFYPE